MKLANQAVITLNARDKSLAADKIISNAFFLHFRSPLPVEAIPFPFLQSLTGQTNISTWNCMKP
jgi:hypothetical protein